MSDPAQPSGSPSWRARRVIGVTSALGALFVAGFVAGRVTSLSGRQTVHPLPSVALTVTVSATVPSLPAPAEVASLQPASKSTSGASPLTSPASTTNYAVSSSADTGSTQSKASTGTSTGGKSGGGTGEVVSSGSGG
jgi:hypothetical protein